MFGFHEGGPFLYGPLYGSFLENFNHGKSTSKAWGTFWWDVAEKIST